MSSTRPHLLDSRIDWTKIVESAADYVLLVNREGHLLYINRAQDGAAKDQALSHTVFDYTAAEFHNQLSEKLRNVFDSGSEQHIEVRRSDPAFSSQWWSIAMSPLRESEQVVAAIFVCRDVSNLQHIRQEQQAALNSLKEKFWREVSAHDRAREILVEEIEVRRKAESSLRESEERYRTLIENARNAIFSIDYEGRFQFLNPVAARDLGGTPEDFMGRLMTDLFPPEIATRQITAIRRVIDSRQGEMRESLTCLLGRYKWYMTSVQPIINFDGSCTAALLESTDIDEQIRSRQQLRKERNFTSSILQTANSLIICLDSQARITVFNGECEAITGYKFEEVVGKSWPELFLPKEMRHEGLNDFESWVRSHPNDRYEGPLLTRSGETRVIFWSNSSFVLEDTGELMAIAIGTDITEFRKLQEQLSAANSRSRAVLEGLPDMVFVIDREGYYREFEGGPTKSLLVPRDEIRGLHLSDVVPAGLAERTIKSIRAAIETGVTQALEYSLETPEGAGVFDARIARSNDEESIIVIRDITQQKRMESELRETTEKLKLEHEALTDKNIALKVVLAQIRQEVEEVKSQVSSNVEKLILPVISRFRKNASERDRVYAELIESLVKEISSTFAHGLQQSPTNLTPREVEICAMIKNDFQSKEIAESLHLSIRTVEKFRQRIRNKLGLANQQINLATYLKSL